MHAFLLSGSILLAEYHVLQHLVDLQVLCQNNVDLLLASYGQDQVECLDSIAGLRYKRKAEYCFVSSTSALWAGCGLRSLK
jgi:hypothetical protein